jgi:RimJ/RimL family protein N-acetyltransferase
MQRDLPTVVLRTERLLLRHMTPGDATFIFDLLNEPAYLRFIGDRKVRTLDAARDYIAAGPADMLRRLGFSFYVVELQETGCPVGVCGLAKRDFLDDVDIGYAFASQHRGQGYAYQAALGVLGRAKNDLGLRRIVATVRAENVASVKLLEKLGLRFERKVERVSDVPDLQLFAIDIAPELADK